VAALAHFLGLRARVWLFSLAAIAGIVLAAGRADAQVTHTTGMVNGVMCDIWAWTDSADMPRTVALKMEGNGNPGHGGYAVQMTYYIFDFSPFEKDYGSYRLITVNPAGTSDGGFGYFVSHERARTFTDGSTGTIAGEIFGVDDSPLGLGFPATPGVSAGTNSGSESFTIQYYHYGTTASGTLDPSTGADLGLPPNNNQNTYTRYNLPATTTWVFQSGVDYPRIDVSVDMSQLIPPGGTTPTPGLVSFDVRGPYGNMVFDNSAGGVVNSVMWGDRQYLFAPYQTPVTRSSTWTWSASNTGARYTVLTVGSLPGTLYEMGLFEPVNAATGTGSALADGYAAERGSTSASFPAGQSYDSCIPQQAQTLPSDGTWPYQSVQYSLPCPNTNPANFLTTTTNNQKIAWGSSAYYGYNFNMVSNGVNTLPINNFPPAPYLLQYSVCVVLAQTKWPPFGGETRVAPPLQLHTIANAALYTAANPSGTNTDCATAPETPQIHFPFPPYRFPGGVPVLR
jgi:hypothetical protein